MRAGLPWFHEFAQRVSARRAPGACWIGGSVIGLALLRAVNACARSNCARPELFDIEKVADGIAAALARPRTLLNSNAVIFENAGDPPLMDAHSKPSAFVSRVRQIRRTVSPKPVRIGQETLPRLKASLKQQEKAVDEYKQKGAAAKRKLTSLSGSGCGEQSARAILKYTTLALPIPAAAAIVAGSLRTCAGHIFATIDKT